MSDSSCSAIVGMVVVAAAADLVACNRAMISRSSAVIESLRRGGGPRNALVNEARDLRRCCCLSSTAMVVEVKKSL